MGLRDWLRERFGLHADREASCAAARGGVPDGLAGGVQDAMPDEWEELPAYLPVDPCEHKVACLVAAAIAAGDRTESEMVIRGVSMVNPEYRLVSCIASVLAAGALEKSSFRVKRIYKHRDSEGEYAAQI